MVTKVGEAVDVLEEKNLIVKQVKDIGILAKPKGAGYSLVSNTPASAWMIDQLGFKPFNNFVTDTCKEKGFDIEDDEFLQTLEDSNSDAIAEQLFGLAQDVEIAHQKTDTFKELSVVQVTYRGKLTWAIKTPDLPNYCPLEDSICQALMLF